MKFIISIIQSWNSAQSPLVTRYLSKNIRTQPLFRGAASSVHYIKLSRTTFHKGKAIQSQSYIISTTDWWWFDVGLWLDYFVELSPCFHTQELSPCMCMMFLHMFRCWSRWPLWHPDDPVVGRQTRHQICSPTTTPPTHCSRLTLEKQILRTSSKDQDDIKRSVKFK